MIPANDSVRLLSAFVEGMDLSDLYATYDRIRKNQASLRQMLKIMIYAAMNGIFSSRAIETACQRDINFMYLLEGVPAPDNSTIARFVSLHLSQCSKNILAATTEQLRELIQGNRTGTFLTEKIRYNRSGCVWSFLFVNLFTILHFIEIERKFRNEDQDEQHYQFQHLCR